MDTGNLLQQARRATVGRSALGWISFLCLIGSVFFWMGMFIDLLRPPRLLSAQTIQAALSVIAFSLILPLFWSMLLPSSPAGRLLQKQTWRTPGYTAVIGAALFLTYHAWRWSFAWWKAQKGVAELNEASMLAITTLIASVLLPALSWCVVTPEQWIAQIEQARQVKRLEWALKMEETTMRAYYARAVALLSAGLSNLTIEQRKELAGILGGFARAQQQAMDQVAASWRQMYGVDVLMGTVDDQQLLDQYKQVADLLTDGGDAMASSADRADQLLPAPPAREGATIDLRAAPRERHVEQSSHVDSRPQSSIPRDTRDGVRRRTPAHADAYLHAARRHFGVVPWTIKKLAEVLDLSETSAKELRTDWLDQALIAEANLGRWYFTE